MHIKLKVLVVTLLLAMAGNTYSAQPRSVKLIEDMITEDDSIYSHYIVKCSDGREIDVSAWDNKLLWCMGKGGKEDCEQKQIKIAKKACRG